MNLVCINTTHPNGLQDPVLVLHQAYPVVSVVHTIAGDPMVSIITDDGEVTRPRHLFVTESQFHAWQKAKAQKEKKNFLSFFTRKKK